MYQIFLAVILPTSWFFYLFVRGKLLIISQFSRKNANKIKDDWIFDYFFKDAPLGVSPARRGLSRKAGDSFITFSRFWFFCLLHHSLLPYYVIPDLPAVGRLRSGIQLAI